MIPTIQPYVFGVGHHKNELEELLIRYGSNSTKFIQAYYGCIVANILLILLLFLHIWWTLLILHIFVTLMKTSREVAGGEYEGGDEIDDSNTVIDSHATESKNTALTGTGILKRNVGIKNKVL